MTIVKEGECQLRRALGDIEERPHLVKLFARDAAGLGLNQRLACARRDKDCGASITISGTKKNAQIIVLGEIYNVPPECKTSLESSLEGIVKGIVEGAVQLDKTMRGE